MNVPTLSRRGILALLLCGLLLPARSGAQQAAAADKDFRHAVALFKSADGYACDVSLRSAVVHRRDGRLSTGSTTEQTARQYASRSGGVVYLAAPGSLAIVTSAGSFHSYSDQKLVAYHLFGDSSDRKAVFGALDASAGGMFDSLLFAGAQLLSKKRKGDLTVFRLGYPKGSVVQEAELQFSRSRNFLASFSYSIERDASGAVTTAPQGSGNATWLRQTITTSGFDKRPPAEVAEFTAATDLLALLRRRFPGYRLEAY